MTTINWKKEAQDRQYEIVESLKKMISINSERDTDHKTAEYPLGPGPAKALDTMLGIAEKDGFNTLNVDNVAGRIEFGEGDEILGILGHVDVVPGGEGWTVTEPYKPVEVDGKIYGRGALDDKGPSLAAYYGLKIIKDLNLPVSKKVHFIFGTDEESEWVGMTRYLKTEPTPDFGFSPDAEFPVINGEKGIMSVKVEFNKPEDQTDDVKIVNFDSGIRENMVPQTAIVDLANNNIDSNKVTSSFNDFLNKNDLSGEILQDDKNLTLKLNGVGSHAMDPDGGRNAGTYLATFLTSLDLNEYEDSYFKFIANNLHLDFEGKKLGINYVDEIMGKLTASPDIFKFNSEDPQASVIINIRYPKGITSQNIVDTINKQSPYNATASISGKNEEPHYVSADDELVKTLLDTYHDHTGNPAEAYTVGGGTYGRILKRGVAFGGLLPGRDNVMHKPDEYIYIDDLVTDAAIYADAIYRLIK